MSSSTTKVIAASTGCPASKKVLASDPSLPCPDDTSPDCTVVRVPITELEGDPRDFILQRAFLAQAKQDFPTTELVAFKESDDIGANAYIAQGYFFAQEQANLRWRVLVAMPMDRSTADAILPGTTMFAIVCVLASIGFVICVTLFVSFWRLRKQSAVQNADWRFTCAFIAGCSVLNLSSLTLLGQNSDELCMLRMWSFNLLFACGASM